MPVTGIIQALTIPRDQHAVAPFMVRLAALSSHSQLHPEDSSIPQALLPFGCGVFWPKDALVQTTNAKKRNDVRGRLSIPFWDAFLPWVHLSVAPVLQDGPSPFYLLCCNLLWFQLPGHTIVSFCVGTNGLLFCLSPLSFTFLFFLCLYAYSYSSYIDFPLLETPGVNTLVFPELLVVQRHTHK